MGATIDYELVFKGSRLELRNRLQSALDEIVKKCNIEYALPIEGPMEEGDDSWQEFLLAEKLKPKGEGSFNSPQNIMPALTGIYTRSQEQEIEDYRNFRRNPKKWRNKRIRKFKKDTGQKPDKFDLEVKGPVIWFSEQNINLVENNWPAIWRKKLLPLLEDLPGDFPEQEAPPEENPFMQMARENERKSLLMRSLNEEIALRSPSISTLIKIGAGCETMLLPFTDWFGSGFYFGRNYVKTVHAAQPVQAHKTVLQILKILERYGLVSSVEDYSRHLFTNSDENLSRYLDFDRASIDMFASLLKSNPRQVLAGALPEHILDEMDFESGKVITQNREEIQQEHAVNLARKN